MDTTGCPNGWATDNWIVHATISCQASLTAFYVVIACFVLVKSFVLFEVWTFWLWRRREMKQVRAMAGRHPIVPSLLTILEILYILMLALVGSNSISAQNGGGNLIYALSSIVWATFCLLLVKKYVNLGRRLIPLAMAQAPSDDAFKSSGPQKEADHSNEDFTRAAERSLSRLNRFDVTLRTLIAFMIASLLMAVTIAIIPGLIYPSEDRWARITFGLVGGFALFLEISLIYHLERLINATRICGQNLAGGGGAKLRRAIKIMRLSQVVWFVLGTITFTIHLLAAVRVLDLSWILMLCLLAIETSASAFAHFATRSRPKAKKDKSSTDKETTTLPAGRTMTLANKTNSMYGASNLGGGSVVAFSHAEAA